MVIDATNLILGRLATYAAKKALEGEKIDIVNSEKAVIVGKKEDILKKYKQRRERGDPHHGPFFPIQSDRIVRRTIRGMLPYKQAKGREAFENVRCYKGVPSKFKDKKLETIKSAKLSDEIVKYLKIERISKFLGGK